MTKLGTIYESDNSEFSSSILIIFEAQSQSRDVCRKTSKDREKDEGNRMWRKKKNTKRIVKEDVSAYFRWLESSACTSLEY